MMEHPDSDPGDVLRHRMHGLLEDVKITWEVERRDPTKAMAGSLLREEYEDQMGISRGGGRGGRGVLKRPFHRTERRRLNHPNRWISGSEEEQETRDRDNDRRQKLN